MKRIETIIIFALISIGFSMRAQMICFDFPADTFSTIGFPNNVAVGDFNGDGLDDIALTHYDEDIISVMVNDGYGQFNNIVTYPIDDLNGDYIIARDITGDDIVDLIVITMWFPIFIFSGNGDGTFYESSYLFLNSVSIAGEVGHFDQDSFPDLAVIQHGEKLGVLQGNGSGSFNESYVYSTRGNLPRTMTKGDFNEDGHDDLVVCNRGMPPDDYGHNIVYFEGTGEGSFKSAEIINDDFLLIPDGVTSGDFNLDGHMDFIVKSYDRHLSKFWGNGDGTFQEPEHQEISAVYYAQYLHEVDIDNNGSLDLAMNHHFFNIQINDGTGYFSDTLFINENSNNHRVIDLTTGNFNGDTLPDIVTTHYEPGYFEYGSITVYMNCFFTGDPESAIPEEEITIYPNPGNGHVKISTGNLTDNWSINGIYNCLGVCIENSRYSISGQYLDLSALDPGLYIVEFIKENVVISKKVFIL
jgi:hypothetical protein